MHSLLQLPGQSYLTLITKSLEQRVAHEVVVNSREFVNFSGNWSLSARRAEGDWRLDSAEASLVDLEGFDLRVQGRSRHPKPGGGP
jgi:hypothetical protein